MKQTLRNILPKNRFARNVSVLAGGAAAAQAIVVVASPIITRLYSPEDFGVLAVFASLLSILGVIASLRYHLAIPLPESDEEAANITVLSLVVVLGMALLTAVIAIPLRQSIAVALNTPLLVKCIFLLPLGLLLTGVYQVFSYWAIRTMEFKAISLTKFTQAFSMIGVQIGSYALGPIGLIFGKLFGESAGVLRLGALVIKKRWTLFGNVKKSSIAKAGKDYRSFPMVSTWNGLANAGGSQLPPLMIALILDPVATGFYALTNRVLSLPVGIISKSIGDVFYREAIEAKAHGKLGYVVVDVYSKMVFACLPIAAVLFFSVPEVFMVLFGDDWAKSGELASWMTLGIFFQVVTTPPGKVFLILDRQGYALLFQLAFLLSAVVSIVIGGVWFEDLTAIVAIMAFSRSAVYSFRFGKILNLVGERLGKMWIPIAKNAPYAAICCLPVIYVTESSRASSYDIYINLSFFLLSMLMATIPFMKIYTKK